MSENARMSADIIPAGESGEFRITEEMLMKSGGDVPIRFLEELLREARKRNLQTSMVDDPIDKSIIVRWRPDTTRDGAEQ